MPKKAKQPEPPQEETRVKLQMSVPRYLQRELESIAKSANRSVAFVAEVTLETALEERESILTWLSDRTLGVFTWALRPSMIPKKGDHETVRVQTLVSADVARKIEVLADQLGHAPSRMAFLLIDGTMDHDFLIAKAALGPIGQAIIRGLGYEVRKDYTVEDGPANPAAREPLYEMSPYRIERLGEFHREIAKKGAA